MTEVVFQQKQELNELIERHSLLNGAMETAIPSLYVYHHTKISDPVYRVYKPSFCVIVQRLNTSFTIGNGHFESKIWLKLPA